MEPDVVNSDAAPSALSRVRSSAKLGQHMEDRSVRLSRRNRDGRKPKDSVGLTRLGMLSAVNAMGACWCGAFDER